MAREEPPRGKRFTSESRIEVLVTRGGLGTLLLGSDSLEPKGSRAAPVQ